MSIAIGTRIGPYEITGWLGAGGMGEVYRARDARLGRDVAIKLIAETFAGDANRVRRFEQEARAAGQLNHPNILVVYDAGIHEGSPYIVSELLDGESLRSRLQAGVLPSRKAIDYARQAAEGLAAAHDKGIVHRDVKPDNLFITKDGRIKILDFGIAKLTTPPDEAGRHTGMPTDTAAGTVVGTVGYMSPEQVRGEVVDARSDIFSVGAVLYEMLTGRAPFTRGTAADSMAAILKEDPPEPRSPEGSPALARIIARCLEKAREARFQSARDLAFGLDVLSGTHATAPPGRVAPVRQRWLAALGAGIVALGLLTALASWMKGMTQSIEQRLAKAKFTYLIDWEGSELDAAISPDGRFVAFLSDREGPFHVWLKQVSAGAPVNLTPGKADQRNVGPNRSVGFSGDGSEVWINGTDGRRLVLVPLMGGASRVFLNEETINVAWSRDGTRLVHFTRVGDPLIVADGAGGNERHILQHKPGDHNHHPAWSPDGRWIYYVHASQSVSEYDVWRILSSGGTPEPLTQVRTDVRYLTPIDARTVLYVAHDRDGSGPWLWALDVEQKTVRRLSVGLDRYLSVAGSADGRRLVATVAKPIAGLWSVPILDRPAEERDVKPQALPTARGAAPRFGGGSLFYLASSGAGDGLWRLQGGKAVEIWTGSDEALRDPPSLSPGGDRVAVVLAAEGKRRLTMISAEGADRRPLAEAIDVRGTSAWSPDGTWVVTGGSDSKGPGLFRVPIDGGAPVRLATGTALDPVVSPDGSLIVYAGEQTATAPLLAVRPDRTGVTLPSIRVLSGGGGRARFHPDGKSLLYLEGPVGNQNFMRLDLATKQIRQITKLSNPATSNTFDIAPDGSYIVFDRVRERSDIVLIDLPK